MRPELASLWLLRHGQSLGNVANEAARRSEIHELDLAERDMDVPLSELGAEQAVAFGTWLAQQPDSAQPDVVIASPYQRTASTARHVVDVASLDVEITLDERLREREFGILDLLTRRGIEARHPTEAVRKERLGKFYYRPPGGESWVDVALRLRSLRDSLVREYADRRVLIVTHEVPIILTRYLVEGLDEQQALEISRTERLANCSLTTYSRNADCSLVLELDAWTLPLERHDAEITDAPDAPVASR